MKKFLIALGIIVVLLIAALFIVPPLIPMETYKSEVEARVKAATGRDLAITGDIELTVLPNLALDVGDVSFANVEGSEAADMATLSGMQLELQLMPLISGEIAIDRFVLVQPVIHLEVDENGNPNWRIQTASGGDGVDGGAGSGTADGDVSGGMPDIRLGEVRIEDGTLTYVNRQTGERREATNVNLSLDLPTMASPLKADGDFVYNGKTVTFVADTGSPNAIAAGQSVPAVIDLRSEDVTLKFNGNVQMADAPIVAGDVDLQIPSLPALADWSGTPLPADAPVPQTIGVTGKLAMNGSQVSFANSEIRIDDMTTTGNMTVDTGGQRPAITAALEVDRMDLNPYLPDEGVDSDGSDQSSGESGDSGDGDATPASQGWSGEEIDFTPLDLVDATLDLKAGSIQVRKIELGRSAVAVVLKNGNLNVNVKEVNLYDGGGSMQFAVDRKGEQPAMTASVDIADVQVEPLLIAAADLDRVSGTGQIKFDVRTNGTSQKSMVGRLAGDGSFSVLDGAIKGLNLAEMVRNFSIESLRDSISEEKKTDFATLQGTFTIDRGTLSNQDLAMKAPLVRADGEGTVNLADRQIDYRLTPKAVASLEGQGGADDAKGLAVPLIIRGPLEDPSITPDMQAIATQALENPEQLGEELQNLKDSLGDGGGLLEGLGGDGDSGKAIEDQLKGLFD